MDNSLIVFDISVVFRYLVKHADLLTGSIEDLKVIGLVLGRLICYVVWILLSHLALNLIKLYVALFILVLHFVDLTNGIGRSFDLRVF